jgi:hypothetical protein
VIEIIQFARCHSCEGEIAIKGIREVLALITLGFAVANTQGKETQREIARSYNVSRWTIARLAS